ncbi:MAG: DUF4329 domain-containing protein, partial [Lachnospiraceae bacterium]|nr:DUF4329 domain-containing protein [Lachnospiraceae bacterium]
DEDKTIDYCYDDCNRLIAYYDMDTGIGKRFTYDYNGNQVLEIGWQLYEGTSEITGMELTESSDYKQYEYDLFNRLTAVRDMTNSYEYSYYADGMRKSKSVNGTAAGFVWNNENLAAETDQNGISAIYEYDLNGVSRQQTDDGSTYYLKNGHGDVTSIYTAAGTPVSSYRYDAFGNQLSVNENDTNPFRYCGEHQDLCSGLIYLRNRYYDPSIGRFISEDPIQCGTNWYIYANNNPIQYTDPLGLAPFDPFATSDEAAADFGFFIGQKSIDEEEEYAAYIYEALDENGDVYYYYDKPRNDYETHEERSTGFSISWSVIEPFAVTHTHGAYDANTSNTKDGFSSPGNSLNPNASDSAGSDASGFDYYVVTPNGSLRRYTANSGNFEGTLIRSDMIVDSRIAIHQHMQNTLLWNLLFANFPNATAQDFVNARRNNPDSLLDTINALESFR